MNIMKTGRQNTANARISVRREARRLYDCHPDALGDACEAKVIKALRVILERVFPHEQIPVE
jgi:hypothetical protein